MCSRCASAINRQPILNGERDLFRVLFFCNRPDNGLQVHCRLQQDGVDTRRKKDLPGPDEDRRRTSRAISLDPDSASRQRLERVLCICFNIISTSVSIIKKKIYYKEDEGYRYADGHDGMSVYFPCMCHLFIQKSPNSRAV